MQQIIHNEDCIAGLQHLQAESVACVVTSPPYNLKKPYSVHNDNMPEADYLDWQGRCAAAIRRVLKPDANLFLNVGMNSEHPWRSIDVALAYRPHFVLQNNIAWCKSIAVNGSTLPAELREAIHNRQIGHFPSINSDHFLNPTFEMVWHFTPAGRSPINRTAPGVGVPYVWPDQPARFGHHRQLHCRGNAWHIPYRTTQSRKDRDFHPAPFPVELVEHCLRLVDLKPDALVVDPFAGTGATLIAAKRLGLAAIGYEIDPAYVEAAQRRLAREDVTAAAAE